MTLNIGHTLPSFQANVFVSPEGFRVALALSRWIVLFDVFSYIKYAYVSKKEALRDTLVYEIVTEARPCEGDKDPELCFLRWSHSCPARR